MIQILAVIAPLFLVIFVSAIFQYWRNTPDVWAEVLNAFVLKVGLPVLLFTSLIQTRFSLSDEWFLIFINTCFVLGSLLSAYVLGKVLQLKPAVLRAFFICFVFGNIAYLGIPTLIQVYGESIVSEASLIIAVHFFWIFTVGIAYIDIKMNKNREDVAMDVLRNVIRNPLLLAVFFGILGSLIGFSLPNVILSSLQMVSASVTPIVLIVIGLFIGKSRFGSLGEWFPVLIFSLVTLLILPGVFYIILHSMGYVTATFSSSIIQAAMPFAITPFALADEYKLDKVFVSRAIVLSTILSAFTLPFWISIVT